MVTHPKKSDQKQVEKLEHRSGSRKAEIHSVYDRMGRAAALARGEILGLKKLTVQSWTREWKRADKSVPMTDQAEAHA